MWSVLLVQHLKSPTNGFSFSLAFFARSGSSALIRGERGRENFQPKTHRFRSEAAMEEHLRENIPPQNSNPEFRSELTRTVSNAAASSSSVALGTRAHAVPCSSTKWTNEKHRLYIHSLESSFVNKLNLPMRSRGCHLQKNVRGPHSTQELPFKTYKSSDQFMVVREKINFPRNETLLESTADSHVTLPSPWICQFTAAGKNFNVASPNLRAHILSSNNRTHPRRNKTLKDLSVTASNFRA